MMLKYFHIALALISGVGFMVRGGIRIITGQTLQQKWLRVTPHIVDTLLLITAIGLVMQTAQYPLEHTWLTAKVLGLLIYIFLGVLVMRLRCSIQTRSLLFVMTLFAYGYIASVALTRNPWLIG